MRGAQGYRADIDGLRAVAVVAVVLFHFDLPGFSGGYLGVDVFFVISGFLITRIIAGDFERGRFSLTQFYERRVRRIVPALAAVLLFSAVTASILLLPFDLVVFNRSLIATVFFASNVFFGRTAGYFGPAAETMPLLHTWSLAVEEQFYLIYPAFLILLLRRGRALPAIWAVLGASFALHLLAAFYAPRWGFYLTPMRFWQLMLGAVLALGGFPRLASRSGREALSLAGLAGVLLWTVHDFALPAWRAIPPTLGAALLIHANGSGETVVGRCLSWRPIVFVGLISYSLYLWHWPILVFARYALMRVPSAPEAAGLIALSFVTASLSWRFIEQPFRGAAARLGRAQLFGFSGAAAAMLLALGAAGLATQGWPQRLNTREAQLASYLGDGGTRIVQDHMQYGTCYLNAVRPSADFWAQCGARPGRTNLLLWGDSHAAHYFPGLSRMGEQTGHHIAQASRSGCPPGAKDEVRDCTQFGAFVRAQLKDFDAVILSARWRIYPRHAADLEMLVDALVLQGIPVIVLGPAVEYHADVPRILMRLGEGAAFDASRYQVKGIRALDDAMRQNFSQREGVTYISVLDALCPDRHCPLTVGGVPAHFDYGHLTPEASSLIARRIWPRIAAALDARSPH